MRCPVCGERAPEGANFCPVCGAMLRAGVFFVNEADACEAAACAAEEAEAEREAFDSLSRLNVSDPVAIGERSSWSEPSIAVSEPTTVLPAIPVGPTIPVIVRADAPREPEVEPKAPIEVAETTVWPVAKAKRSKNDKDAGDGAGNTGAPSEP